MSIKNPEKIHFVRENAYLCNRACFTTKEKSTKQKENVTCLNCLHLLKKEKLLKEVK